MYEYKARLVRVIDGGTIDADIDMGFQVHIDQRIKLFGVYAPDPKSHDTEERERGLASKNRLIEILPKEIIVQTMLNKRGKFGRILADVIVYHSAQDRWCGATEIMIQEGYGVKYHGQSKEDIQEQHLANRIKLQEAGLVNKE